MNTKSDTWKKGIVYQIYPRSFKDSNADGIGDIPGIISKLDYVKNLGIDMIWLSPVYGSPNDDNGYDVSNYVGINPEYGTMDDMDLLIKEAKHRDMKIIMDLVINHTSDEHPWFIESKNPMSPYRDYYIWAKKPNNWTSFFGGSAWDQVGDSYYLHLFSKKQPDLNWNNPKVMEEIQKIMRFWLDKGIYGFRCDVINIIYKSSLEDGKKRFVLTGKEHYHSQEGCHEILRRLRSEVLSDYDAFTVGETVMVTPKEANDLIHPERKELDMVFSFEHMETDQINNKWFKTKFNPNKFMKTIARWQQEVYWNANYLENHDQPRSVSRFGDDKKYHYESATMLATLNLTLKGTPFIYQGQEIGMTNGDFKSLDEYQDVETHRIYQIARRLHFPKWYIKKMIERTSRDNARQPMQWDDTSGFSKGKPWLKINANQSVINVFKQEREDNSILRYYKTLIGLRKSSKTLTSGSFKPLYMKHGVFIYQRYDDKKTYCIVLNMTKRPRRVPVKFKGSVLLSNYGVTQLSSHRLMPFEALVILEDIIHD